MLLRSRREPCGIRLGSLVSALLLTAVLSAPAAPVDYPRGPTVVALQDPPAYPDGEHVANGCYVSTIAFLARFQAEFPDERGVPLVMYLRNAKGVRWSHTIAVISWRGKWWGRDEYYGVFALDRSVGAYPEPEQLANWAANALQKHSARLIRARITNRQPAPPTEMSAEERTREVAAVARMVPVRASVFWVKCGRQELPVVFFRPSDHQIAVYEPLHGTAVAECAFPDNAKVVAAVAVRLGYRVDGVRAEPVGGRGILLAPVRGRLSVASN